MNAVARSTEATKEVNWRKCPQHNCSADFDKDPDDFIISGDGDWIDTIVCKKCNHVRRKIPVEILAELLRDKWYHPDLTPHLTIDYIVEFLEVRKEWWSRRIRTEELVV